MLGSGSELIGNGRESGGPGDIWSGRFTALGEISRQGPCGTFQQAQGGHPSQSIWAPEVQTQILSTTQTTIRMLVL